MNPPQGNTCIPVADSLHFIYFIFKLYNIVLVLPYIEMNLPQAYTCSPSWTLLPHPSPYHPSGASHSLHFKGDSWEKTEGITELLEWALQNIAVYISIQSVGGVCVCVCVCVWREM